MLKHINSVAEFDEAIKEGLVLVDFLIVCSNKLVDEVYATLFVYI